MEAETVTLTEGDIYRWHYRSPGDDNRAWGQYHCCSCIGIVRRGRLYDTYWMIGTAAPSEGRSFGADNLHKIELTRLGNLADLDEAKSYQAAYYDDADIVDIRHANSSHGCFYLRKGAKRSKRKMLETAQRRLELAEQNKRSAIRRAADMQAAIEKILTGDIDAVHLG